MNYSDMGIKHVSVYGIKTKAKTFEQPNNYLPVTCNFIDGAKVVFRTFYARTSTSLLCIKLGFILNYFCLLPFMNDLAETFVTGRKYIKGNAAT